MTLLCRLVGAIMGTPADVVKARVMNQPTDRLVNSFTIVSVTLKIVIFLFLSSGKGLVYKSSGDCFMKTVNGEGFLGT